MKRMKLLVVVALALVICLPGMAKADITLSGGLGWYWSQPGTITFDKFVSYFSDTSTFSSAVVGTSAATIGYSGSFAGDGWTGTYINGTMTQASGPATTTLAWDYNFLGSSMSFPVTLDINYFNNNVFQGHEGYTLTSRSTYTGGFDQNQVPLPPSVLLMGTGILGLVGLGWRRRKTS